MLNRIPYIVKCLLHFVLSWKYVFKIISPEWSRPKWDEGSLTRGWKAHFLTLFNVLKSFIILHSNETKPFAVCSQKQTVSKCISPDQNMHFGESAHHVELCAAGKPAPSPCPLCPKVQVVISGCSEPGWTGILTRFSHAHAEVGGS